MKLLEILTFSKTYCKITVKTEEITVDSLSLTETKANCFQTKGKIQDVLKAEI